MPKAAGDDKGGRVLSITGRVLDIFFPHRCAICDRALASGEKYLCGRCTGRLEYTGEEYCLRCGRPVGETEEYCKACTGKGASYCSGRSLFLYNAVLKESIIRFKYHGRQEYAAFYADEMYHAFGGWLGKIKPDALVPVPIHKERYRKRGFNQAELLAKELGKRSNIPVLADCLVRGRNTLPQKELSERERIQNLQGAFYVRKMTQELYKNVNCVIIIDDIYTTGSTVEACARALCEEGIETVYFLCISTGQGL